MALGRAVADARRPVEPHVEGTVRGQVKTPLTGAQT